jgi:hypothetical protein
MFLERKILERIHGQKYFHFDAILGWKHLQDDIDHFGASNPLTKLVPNLEGIDPDDVRRALLRKRTPTLFCFDMCFTCIRRPSPPFPTRRDST